MDFPLLAALRTTPTCLLPGDVLEVKPGGVDQDEIPSLVGQVFPGEGVAETTVKGELCFVATRRGVVSKIDRMIRISGRGGRATSSVGDLVVGRVYQAQPSLAQWRIDIGAPRLAVLPIGSATLPGDDALRRRTEADTLQMRRHLCEGDVMVAEVQRISPDGMKATLHTRNLKFGKLMNGAVLEVPADLVLRSQNQLGVLPFGKEDEIIRGRGEVEGNSVFVVFGVNGLVWVGAPPKVDTEATVNFAASGAEEEKVQPHLRGRIARVRSLLKIMALNRVPIAWGSLSAFVQGSGVGGLNLSLTDLRRPEKGRELIEFLLASRIGTT